MPTFHRNLLLLPFFLSVLTASGQDDDKMIRQKVLKADTVDSLFVFGKWSEKGSTETHLKYLGQLTTTQGKILKVMTSIWFWGLSHRATSRILIFNENNQYLGNYNVGIVCNVPDQLVNGKLIFNPSKYGTCDRKAKEVISFQHGLPRQFFLKVQGNYGDIISFSGE